jgi:putative transposase
MKTLASEYPVVELCHALGLSRSGYYNWLNRPESHRAKANREVLDKITVLHEENRRCYGSPRMTHALRRQGLRIGKNRVARLMRTQGIRAKSKRAFRPRTTDSRHAERIAPNRLKELPGLNRPDQAWVVDITYIWTAAGWVYLAAVMDLYSRRIVGWALESSLQTSLVTEALSRAQKERRPAPGLLHHSDRGSQYASSAYHALLANFKIIASMSGLAHCYDNAAMESFWSSLKNELVHQQAFANLDEARLAIFDYIELFYNRKRLHSALGYQSPVEFENQIVYKNN